MQLDWKSLPSLSSLRAFDAVAREGDFSAAARSLNVTHAAISQQVRGLEQDLGLALAQRAGRSIVLTDDGKALAAALRDGFSTIASGITNLRTRNAQRGLRVATTPHIVDALLMPNLSRFWADHPGIEIALQPSVNYVDLVAEGYDLGVRAAPLGTTWPGLDARELAKSRWLIVGAPDLIAQSGRDPFKLPWVWSNEMPGEIAELRRANVDVDALTKVDIGDWSLHWAAARRGLGLTLASEHVAHDVIASGEMVELPLPGLTTSAYYAVTPKGPRRPLVDSFIDWLRVIFQSQTLAQ